MAYAFVSDRPALDFVATVAERGTTDVEQLGTPADLAGWIAQSGLVDDVRRLSPADLRRARDLREAAWVLVSALIDGAPATPAARAAVNTAARRPGPRAVLDPSGRVRHLGGLDAALSAIAADVIDLHGDADRPLLSWCEAPRCTRPFVDRSRGRRRRWCGMRGCGDRVKAAAYRARHRP